MINLILLNWQWKNGRYALIFLALALMALGSGAAFVVTNHWPRGMGMFLIASVSLAIVRWYIVPALEREIKDANKKGK